MTHLLHLNLSDCSLGSHGARVLSTVIPFVSKLQSLYLTHNHIFGRSMHRICGIISSLIAQRKRGGLRCCICDVAAAVLAVAVVVGGGDVVGFF